MHFEYIINYLKKFYNIMYKKLKLCTRFLLSRIIYKRTT